MKDGLEMNIVDTGDVDGDPSLGLRDHNADGLDEKSQASQWCDGFDIPSRYPRRRGLPQIALRLGSRNR